MSLLKDTVVCAFDGVTPLLKLIADKQMKHANTSLLVKSSSLRVLNVAGMLSRRDYSGVKTKLLICYFCVTKFAVVGAVYDRAYFQTWKNSTFL